MNDTLQNRLLVEDPRHQRSTSNATSKFPANSCAKSHLRLRDKLFCHSRNSSSLALRSSSTATASLITKALHCAISARLITFTSVMICSTCQLSNTTGRIMRSAGIGAGESCGNGSRQSRGSAEPSQRLLGRTNIDAAGVGFMRSVVEGQGVERVSVILRGLGDEGDACCGVFEDRGARCVVLEEEVEAFGNVTGCFCGGGEGGQCQLVVGGCPFRGFD
ncbi:hypothetical protein N7519_011074 [Penicillium mononematosum]|uniref:uncharacterized protein n=1 Tax=Penicillium mononematosum TaxID=268346 RepID=UPI002546E9FA|nr:uncharacterized protein N7519_011074 [Penicillium mononematosum]KAJ6180613.1 hypothetical protein N7519_011074 [Penicillium mononematosum]